MYLLVTSALEVLLCASLLSPIIHASLNAGNKGKGPPTPVMI